MTPVAPEIVRQVWELALTKRVEFGVALAAVLVGLILERLLRGRLGRALPFVVGVVTAGIVGAGLYRASQTLWLCDDAFITFRYAQNLMRGHGLTFNPGEWVEGYTNFLWAVILGFAGKLGFDIPHTGLVLNLVSFGIAIFAVSATVFQTSPSRVLVPFSAVAIALASAFTHYASSGLETMPAACFVGLGLWASREKTWLAGVFLVCAALCRPDHILYGVAMGAALIIEGLFFAGGPSVKRIFGFTAPFLFIFLPYWLIRWRVYGDFYPNTYYAKSGNLSYWSQGFVYLTHFLSTTGAWLAFPLLLALLFGRLTTRHELRSRVFAFFSVVLVTLYVTRVGGDFMEHRFFIGLFPVVAVAIELSVRARAGGSRPLMVALGVATVTLAVTPLKVIKPYEKKWHLAAEESFYPLVKYEPLEVGTNLFREAKLLSEVFKSMPVKPRFAIGCVGFTAYYTDIPLVDIYGLANRRIAHRDIRGERGRPGHEKWAVIDDIVAEGAVISDPPYFPGWEAETRVDLPGYTLYVVRWRQDVIDVLAAAGGRVPNLDADIRRWASSIDREAARKALLFYRQLLDGEPTGAARLAPLERRVSSWVEFDNASAGASTGSFSVNDGVLTSDGVGEWSIPVPADFAGRTIRFSMSGPKDARLGVRIGSAEFHPGGSPTLETFAWTAPSPVPAELKLVVFDSAAEAGVDLRFDALRFVPPGEGDRLAPLKQLQPAARLSAWRSVEPELAATEPVSLDFSSQVHARWSFDEATPPAEVKVTGSSFGTPATGVLTGQTVPTGFQGARFFNGFHGGDTPLGSIEVPLPASSRIAVSFLFGGGGDFSRVYVALLAGATELARACGRGSEALTPTEFDVEVPPGSGPLRLVAMDNSTDPWGHLNFDDVMVWHKPPAQ